MEKAFFITATGTDTGKTFVSTGLLEALLLKNCRPLALKPVISGFMPENAAFSDSALLLRTLLNRPPEHEEINLISPFRFKAPLSPDMAAELEEKPLNYQALITFCREKIAASSEEQPLLIEGIGGIAVPLTADKITVDWIKALHIPVVLVTEAALGTLSHTLCAAYLLKTAGLPLAAVILNEARPTDILLSATEQSLRTHWPQTKNGPVKIFKIPFGAKAETFAAPADFLLNF